MPEPKAKRSGMDFAEWKAAWGVRLNDQQEAAVQAAEGPVLLLAVPGSGKTTALIHRLGYLIFCRGVAPEHILTVTYTVSATKDMAARFAQVFGADLAGRLEFRTINGLSARIIRYYEKTKGRTAFALITSERKLSSLVGDLCQKATGEFPTESTVKSLRTAITYIKNKQLGPETIEKYPLDDLPVGKIYHDYCDALRQYGWMDFDDQMVYAARILRKYPEILRAFQDRYRYLCVDEAQDTSRIQHTILRLLAGQRQNLFLVGDEDQSIYGFRAAEPSALLHFEQDYPGAKVLLLERNYRSTARIVQAADAFIRQNQHRRDKHMVAVRDDGPVIQPIWVADRVEQYAFLARLAATCDRETAVLARNNDSALPVLDLLDRQGIGCRCRQIEGSFFSHRIVRDVEHFITLAYEPTNGEAFLPIYYKLGASIKKAAAHWAVRESRQTGEPILELLADCPGISQKGRHRCASLARRFQLLPGLTGDQAIDRIRRTLGYGAYLDDREMDSGKLDILESLGKQTDSPKALLARLRELQGIVAQGSSDPESPFLISTIHSSKGLEYQRVILMDVADGILPSIDPPRGSHPDPEEVELYEEERRLFYVGMTRAKEELAIFRFRREGLESTFANTLFPYDQKVAHPPERESGPREHLSPGDRVDHKIFGPGRIVSRQGDIASIRFEDGTEKRFALAAAVKKNLIRKG